MGDTSIEWTDKTWNPIRGCSRVSAGCERCYAEAMAGRFSGPGQAFEGLTRKTATGARWTGVVRMVPEHLADPLRWEKPRRVFVNSMSDLFHEGLSDEAIAAAFGVMAAAGRHTFQVLTKRPERMRAFFAQRDPIGTFLAAARRAGVEVGQITGDFWRAGAPLPNVWLGVSVEDQATADERIPLLLETPAAVRFVSYEPALGPVDFERYLWRQATDQELSRHLEQMRGRSSGVLRVRRGNLHWIIAGSESGPRARPAELDWFRQTRDQCAAAGVSFFFKQYTGIEVGTMVERRREDDSRGKTISLPVLDGRQHAEFPR